ncbi:MAG: hypothetical protein WBA74_12285, partial [Cyclobacteriaceae bacterium]
MKLHITHISCNVNDEFDGDEIYLKYKGEKIWPTGLFKGIRTGEVLPVDAVVELPEGGNATIELWEYDLLTRNDYLGTFDMVVNETGGPFQTSLKLANQDFLASYLLTW